MAPLERADHDDGVRYQFLTDRPPASRARTHSTVSGFTVSLLVHATALIVAMMAVARSPLTSTGPAKPSTSVRLVYTPRLGDGGGGGGEQSAQTAKRAQLVGAEAIAVPAARPIQLDPVEPQVVPPPQVRLAVFQPTVADGMREVVGAVSEVGRLDTDRGPGTGAGADGGRGPGAGPGTGPGLGPGAGAGEGEEGEYPGDSASWPRLLREVKPNYTAEAMRARIEGKVDLEIVVLADGSVGRVTLVRSLDSRFGLDEEAINAVRRWRFDPGRRAGKAIAVRVGVELSFTLR
jgi:protein TonB